jgi:hypothetical protein
MKKVLLSGLIILTFPLIVWANGNKEGTTEDRVPGADNKNNESGLRIEIQPTPLDDYQVVVKLAPSAFDFSGFLKDGANIRFYDEKNNKLNYWIESYNPKRLAVIWIKVKLLNTAIIFARPAPPDAPSESSGESVFDKVSWETFRKNWEYSGVRSGRVGGWEDALTEYKYDTSGWNRIDIDSRYGEDSAYSRWFLRKEFFISACDISFSGSSDNAQVWSLIGSDEMYRKIGGDERDVDGKTKGSFMHSFSITKDFGRYVWAGRGQILKGHGGLFISDISSGLQCLYVRKEAPVRAVSKKEAVLPYENSIFPGDPESLPEKSITRGWRAWAGAENMYVQKEGTVPVLVSPVLGESQRFIIPVNGFDKKFEMEFKLKLQTPASYGEQLSVTIGPVVFGIIHDRSNIGYTAFLGKMKFGIGAIDEKSMITLKLSRHDDNFSLDFNNNRIATMQPGDEKKIDTENSIKIAAMNPKIYGINLITAAIKNKSINHDVYFRENFSGMREGAVFYGWKGIENFKAVRDVERIALITLQDNTKEELIISDVPCPDNFTFNADVGAPISRESKFEFYMKIGTIEFGVRLDKGKYKISFMGSEKESDRIVPGKKAAISIRKTGSEFSLFLDDEEQFGKMSLSNFLLNKTITITGVNPKLYDIYLEKLESISDPKN